MDPCHADILSNLDLLDGAITDYGNGQSDEAMRKSVRQVVKFFDEVAAPHHLNEEREVFPVLLARGDDELVQQVRRLQQDHGWLEQDWLELAPQLRALGENNGWTDPAMIRELVDIFAGLYRDHIELEETLIYPTARRMTQEADRARQRRRQRAEQQAKG
jgi:hemerythrin-like domain-containing protein